MIRPIRCAQFLLACVCSAVFAQAPLEAVDPPAPAAVEAFDAYVSVEGIIDLSAYAAVSQALAQVPGVQRVAIQEIAAGTAIFRVTSAGGSDAVAAALASHPRLAPSAKPVPGLLSLVYRP